MYPWLCITDDRKNKTKGSNKKESGGDDDSVTSAKTVASEAVSETAN